MSQTIRDPIAYSELPAFFGVARGTVYSWIQRGHLTRAQVYSRAELVRWGKRTGRLDETGHPTKRA